MKEVYLAILQNLATDVPSIRWTDFDLGQFESQPKPAVSWPAVLVGFPEALFTSVAYGQGFSILPFSLRVGFLLRERTHSKNTPTTRNEALEHLDTCSAIIRSLKGTSGDSFSGIRFLNRSMEVREDYRVYTLTFQTTLYACTELPWKPIANYKDAPIPVIFDPLPVFLPPKTGIGYTVIGEDFQIF